MNFFKLPDSLTDPLIKRIADYIFDHFDLKPEYMTAVYATAEHSLNGRDWSVFKLGDDILFVSFNYRVYVVDGQFKLAIYEIILFEGILEFEGHRKTYTPLSMLINENLN